MNLPQTQSNPFVGLRPFSQNESLIFFGRRQETIELLQKLHEQHFVAVLGHSGCGKSSLIRAALIPKLQAGFLVKKRDQWHIVLMRPGARPLNNFLQSLLNCIHFNGNSFGDTKEKVSDILDEIKSYETEAIINFLFPIFGDSNANLLLVVDQFEEIFRYQRYAEYKTEAKTFISLMLGLAAQRHLPIFVVMTMRSDFLGDCISFYNLPEAINKSIYLIPRLSPDQLREAIEMPIKLYGSALAPQLLERLLNDAEYDPDLLPILQHALMRIWDRSRTKLEDSETIDLPDYEEIGSLDTALPQHVDEIFATLVAREQKIAETLFRSLTEMDETNRAIRRPTKLEEVCEIATASIDEVASVVNTFRESGRSFLFPPAGIALMSDTIIDISHESLIRNWTRLNKWLEEEMKSAAIYERLAETAVLHKQGMAALFKGPELNLTFEWFKYQRPNRAWALRYHPEFELAMVFLEQSKMASDRENELFSERLSIDKKKIEKRYKKAIVILILIFIIVLTLVIYWK